MCSPPPRAGSVRLLLQEEKINIQQAYSVWSSTYDVDRNLTRDLDRLVTENILAPFRFSSIVEIGCGTGKNTSFLTGIGDKILALDFSEGMLEQARAKVRSGQVTFARADLTMSWPCPDHAADLVSCNLVLEHIRDLDFIFAQAARVLAPGGRFFVCELHPFRQYQGSKANFQRDEQKTEIPAFVHHLSDFWHAGERSGFALESLHEWWHEQDQDKPPRLLSLLYTKREG
jgi:ubiquinone/menaquinone biosynthesis C-methylase UbiE